MYKSAKDSPWKVCVCMWVNAHACLCICVLHAKLLQSHLFVTLWTTTRQAPLSMRFFRQEYWRGLPFPPSGDLPDPGIEPASPAAPELQAGSLLPEPPGKTHSRELVKSDYLIPFSVRRLKFLLWLPEVFIYKKQAKFHFCSCSKLDLVYLCGLKGFVCLGDFEAWSPCYSNRIILLIV